VIQVIHIFLMLLNTPLCDKIDITVGTDWDYRALLELDLLARLWYVDLLQQN